MKKDHEVERAKRDFGEHFERGKGMRYIIKISKIKEKNIFRTLVFVLEYWVITITTPLLYNLTVSHRENYLGQLHRQKC